MCVDRFQGNNVVLIRSVAGFAATLCAVSVAAAQASRADAWTLAALARDVDAVVLADAQGAPRRVNVGETAPGDAWRLAAIRDGRAHFVAIERRDGRVVELALDVGQRLPPRVGTDEGNR